MTRAIGVRGSLSIGLLVAGSLCVACGSDASGDGSLTPGGSAGTSASGLAGSTGMAGTAATSGGSGSGTAGTSGATAGTGGTFGSGGSGAGSGGSVSGTAGGGSGGMPSGGMSGSTGASGAAGGTPSGKTEFAPYYEIGATTGASKNLVDMKTKSGVSDVTLAFALAGTGCSADKTISGDSTDINAFVAAGGHVKASFGGADGKYLEANCADANSLATAFSNFVDATKITDLDFDIEQGPMETAAMNTMRGQALKMVQDSKHVEISFTLQTDEGGLDKGARAVLSGAIAAGVTVYHVNLMVMDYGLSATTDMAKVAIGSLDGANAQLKTLIPGLTTEQAYAMLGATPDIGQNDDAEIFTLQHAKDLAAYAVQNKLGLITFWNIQRDQVCGKGECSQQDNANFDYANVFKTLAQ